jgi:hypothetical protein
MTFRTLCLLPLVLLTRAPAKAQLRPVEVPLRADHQLARRLAEHRCRGCDCLEGQCFTPVCDCTLPVTQEWAEGMLAAIIRVLSPVLNGFDGHEVALRVRVVDPETLGTFGGAEAQAVYQLGSIRISNRLSRHDAVAVLAHEFGHAWHEAHNPAFARAGATQVEGFAEWVAYQALRRFGDQVGSESIKTNVDPIYGDGFRFYLRAEREQGIAKVLAIAATWVDLDGTRISDEERIARPAPLHVSRTAVAAPTTENEPIFR